MFNITSWILYASSGTCYCYRLLVLVDRPPSWMPDMCKKDITPLLMHFELNLFCIDRVMKVLTHWCVILHHVFCIHLVAHVIDPMFRLIGCQVGCLPGGSVISPHCWGVISPHCWGRAQHGHELSMATGHPPPHQDPGHLLSLPVVSIPPRCWWGRPVVSWLGTAVSVCCKHNSARLFHSLLAQHQRQAFACRWCFARRLWAAKLGLCNSLIKTQYSQPLVCRLCSSLCWCSSLYGVNLCRSHSVGELPSNWIYVLHTM